MQPLQSFATEHVDDVQVWSPCLKLEGNITTLTVSKFFSIWETKIVSFFFLSQLKPYRLLFLGTFSYL